MDITKIIFTKTYFSKSSFSKVNSDGYENIAVRLYFCTCSVDLAVRLYGEEYEGI